MKYTALSALLILLMIAPNTAISQGLTEINLIDGTIISGELVSFTNGIYTINSTTLGTLKIKETNVSSIRSKTSPSKAPADIANQAAIRSLQNDMMADEDIMKIITSLLQDPDFQEILQDEEIMRAISSGDIDSLQSNPKFQQLLNKPTVEQIKKGIE